MKSSVTIPCHCGHLLTLGTSGTQPLKDTLCPKCHTAIFVVEPLGNPVAIRILNRVRAELEEADSTLVIALSAMAVECELARLFFKWEKIELMATQTPSQADKDGWEKQWRGWFGIALRIDKVSELLTGEKFDSFLAHHGALLGPVYEKFPNLKDYQSPKDLFQKEFFNKRNKIVHLGEINFQQADGEMCFSLAATLFHIMNEMDSQRNKHLRKEHAAALEKKP